MKQISLIITFFFLNILSLDLYAQNETVILPNYNAAIYCFALSEDNQSIYYPAGNTLVMYSLANNNIVKTFDIHDDSPVVSMKIKENGEYIYLGTKSGKVISVSVLTGESKQLKDYNSGSINAMAITSDGSLLLCGCENGMVYKHSLNQINTDEEFYQYDGTITSIEVSEKMELIAISSSKGTIALFKEAGLERIGTIIAGKKWVRKVAFNESEKRLINVGDDGSLYQWNIVNPNKIRLIDRSKVSGNWLLSLDVAEEGKVLCWGGLDHILKVRTLFANYEKRFKGPVLKAQIICNKQNQISVACCILGGGIQIVSLFEMKYKTNF